MTDGLRERVEALLTRPATVEGLPEPGRGWVEKALHEMQDYLRAALAAPPPADPNARGFRAGIEAAARAVETTEPAFAYGVPDANDSLARAAAAVRALASAPPPAAPDLTEIERLVVEGCVDMPSIRDALLSAVRRLAAAPPPESRDAARAEAPDMLVPWLKVLHEDGPISTVNWQMVAGWALRALAAAPPPYCAVHQHYKWCEHNGGVMGSTGYEASAPSPLPPEEPARSESRCQWPGCGAPGDGWCWKHEPNAPASGGDPGSDR